MNRVTIIDSKTLSKVSGGALDDNESDSGPIVLQAHGTVGQEFRNLSIEPVVNQDVAATTGEMSTSKAETKSLKPNEHLIGSTLFRGHNYKVFLEAGLDWKTAKDRCEAMGGHLVTVSNEQENKFMIALATKTIGDINNSGIWLGATDERNEGQWEWIDGTPFKYSNWNEGQPNGNRNEN